MLSRLFHRLDEAHIHRRPDTLSCRHWWNVLLPASVWDFFTKKGNGKLVAAWGREGGWLVVEVGEKRVWEREREGGCSHLELLHGTFTGGSAPHTAPFGFIGRRRQAGRWRLAGRVRGRAVEMLTVSYDTCTLPTGSTSTAITSERGNVGLLVWKAASCLMAFLIIRSSHTLSPWICPMPLLSLSPMINPTEVPEKQDMSEKVWPFIWLGVCKQLHSWLLALSYTSHKRYSAHSFAARPNVSLKRRPSMQKQTVWLVFRLWTWQD